MAQQAGPPGPQANMQGYIPLQQQMFQAQAQRAPQSLGLGLGLNAGQRQGFMNAAQQGQGASWLGEHKAVARKVQNKVQPGSAQEGRLQSFIATGIPQTRLEASKY